MTVTTAVDMAREVINRLPVKVSILLLSVAVGYGFVRISRVEATLDFLACEALARIKAVSPLPCISSLESPDRFLPDAINNMTENP